MIEAAGTAKAAIAALAMMAVHGTALALIAFAIVRGARVRPAWRSAVWLVVIAKFVLPWGPALPWSLADVIATLRGEALDGGVVAFGAPGDASLASGGPAASLGWLIVAAVWAAGSAFVIVRAALAYHRIRQTARRAPPAGAEAIALLAELAARVRVRAPRLVVGPAELGPLVVGVVRPIIVIPRVLLDDADDQRAMLRAALLHELAHVRRRDALGRIVQLVAFAMFWFWPVVHVASRQLELARESACDAWALEACDIARPAYARLLLRMSQLQTGAASALAAPHALGARVAGVLGAPARPRLGLIHRIVLIAWIAVALGGARAEANNKPTACVYTPELAEALRLAHPEADVDGDGVLSHDEACDFQAEMSSAKRWGGDPDGVPGGTGRSPVGSTARLDAATAELLAEPLCCNCEPALGRSQPVTRTDVGRCEATP